LDQAGNAAETAAAEITGYKTYAELLEALDTRRKQSASAMRFGHFEGIQVFLNLGTPGILILIFLANCIVGTAVWLWRKI